jgi:hypothetical protein
MKFNALASPHGKGRNLFGTSRTLVPFRFLSLDYFLLENGILPSSLSPYL